MSDQSSAPSKAQLRVAALAARDALGDKKRGLAAKALAKRGLPLEIADATSCVDLVPRHQPSE